jgi:hypothetical protein
VGGIVLFVQNRCSKEMTNHQVRIVTQLDEYLV